MTKTRSCLNCLRGSGGIFIDSALLINKYPVPVLCCWLLYIQKQKRRGEQRQRGTTGGGGGGREAGDCSEEGNRGTEEPPLLALRLAGHVGDSSPS